MKHTRISARAATASLGDTTSGAAGTSAWRPPWRKFLRFGHHARQHSSHFFVSCAQPFVILSAQVAGLQREIQPHLCFGCLPIAVGHLARKHAGILSLSKPLSQIGSDAPGRTPNLTSQGVALLRRKRLGQPEYLSRQTKGDLVDPQILMSTKHSCLLPTASPSAPRLRAACGRPEIPAKPRRRSRCAKSSPPHRPDARRPRNRRRR